MPHEEPMFKPVGAPAKPSFIFWVFHATAEKNGGGRTFITLEVGRGKIVVVPGGADPTAIETNVEAAPDAGWWRRRSRRRLGVPGRHIRSRSSRSTNRQRGQGKENSLHDATPQTRVTERHFASNLHRASHESCRTITTPRIFRNLLIPFNPFTIAPDGHLIPRRRHGLVGKTPRFCHTMDRCRP